jgi:hypothetical protein
MEARSQLKRVFAGPNGPSVLKPRPAGGLAWCLRTAWAGLSVLTLATVLASPLPLHSVRLKGLFLNLLTLNVPGSVILTAVLGLTPFGSFETPAGLGRVVSLWCLYTAIGYIQWFLLLPRTRGSSRTMKA